MNDNFFDDSKFKPNLDLNKFKSDIDFPKYEPIAIKPTFKPLDLDLNKPKLDLNLPKYKPMDLELNNKKEIPCTSCNGYKPGFLMAPNLGAPPVICPVCKGTGFVKKY